MSEWDIIEAIKIFTASGDSGRAPLVAGIGDDCAVFETGSAVYGLITTDMSVEHVHFERSYATPADIGCKAMTANISDIAAMGGDPLYAFVSLGIPEYLDQDYIISLYEGMQDASAGLKLKVAGGDLSRSSELVISITLYGEVSRDRLVLRKGAKPGDTVYVTGTLGDSEAGLELLKDGTPDIAPRLVRKHLRPAVRIGMVPEIISEFAPTAMIDVSDGLLSDLRHICAESGAGFLLDGETIPISESLSVFARRKNVDPLDYALRSGEEYELLFTSEKKSVETVIGGTPVRPVGRITESGFRISRNGIIEAVKIRGYDHFKEEKKQ